MKYLKPCEILNYFIFQKYAEFLCQAVYTVFYRAFPDSRLQFSDWFKQNICDTIYEWVMGVRTIPGSYKDWKINPDINLTVKTDLKVTSTSESIKQHFFIIIQSINFDE